MIYLVLEKIFCPVLDIFLFTYNRELYVYSIKYIVLEFHLKTLRELLLQNGNKPSIVY